VYEGLHYVPDMVMRKMRKGRRKKKCIHNEMDGTEKGYNNDMYGSGDFDQNKTKVHCLVYHGEGHAMEKHKDGPKRKPRNSGAKDANRRRGTSAIIEVSHI
jgi:ribonuclease PH